MRRPTRPLLVTANMMSTHSGRLVVVVYNWAPPTDTVWKQYLAFVQSIVDPSQYRVLIYTAGGGPSAAQAEAMGKALRHRPALAACVVKDYVPKSFEYNPRMKVFKEREVDQALQYLQLRPREEVRMANLLVELMSHLELALPQEALQKLPLLSSTGGLDLPSDLSEEGDT